MPAVHPGITAGALTGLVAAFTLIGGISRAVWNALKDANRNAAKIEKLVIDMAGVVEDVEALKASNQQQDIELAVSKALAAQRAGPDTRPAPG